jgi:hypothetical protein
MSIGTGVAPIYAAIITGTAALVGVLIGGLLQYFLSERQYERKRTQSLKNAASLFIAEILPVLNEFSDEKNMYKILALNLRMPKFLQEQLGILYTAVSEFDPKMAIDILWTRQACANVDSYLEEAKTISKTSQLDPKIPPVLGMALVDVNNAIKYAKQIVIRRYNSGGRKARTELFSCESFQAVFAEKSSKRGPIIKLLMKYGLKRI